MFGNNAEPVSITANNQISIFAGNVKWMSGTGTPEGAVAAAIGSMYTDQGGAEGTVLYIKESGTGNTGWVNSNASVGDNVFALEGEEATLATVTQTAIASFDATVYGSGKFIIQTWDTVTGDRQVVEILVTHDGTTAVATEYAIVDTAGSLATFDVSLAAGTVSILATDASTNSTEHNIVETLILI